jgi:hypothetical protein
MAFKVIVEDGSVSMPKVVGTRQSDGLAVEEFQVWPSGSLIPESEIAPRIVDLYDGGDLYTRTLIARVKSADDDEVPAPSVPDSTKPVDQGGNQPVGTSQDPADAVPANAVVPSDSTEPGPSADNVSDAAEDYESFTIPVLKEKISGRGLTVPSDANKPDLIKILQDDDKSGTSNPFTQAA